MKTALGIILVTSLSVTTLGAQPEWPGDTLSEELRAQGLEALKLAFEANARQMNCYGCVYEYKDLQRANRAITVIPRRIPLEGKK